MKPSIFLTIYKKEQDTTFILRSLPKVLTKENYQDKNLTNLLYHMNLYSKKITFRLDSRSFKDFSIIFDVLNDMDLGEEDTATMTKIFKVYLEYSLKMMQEDEQLSNELKRGYIAIIEKTLKKFPSRENEEIYQKAVDRLISPLLINEGDAVEGDLEIGAVSKLKAADIKFILNNPSRYTKESLKKFIFFMIKKDRERDLYRNNFDRLLILEESVNLFNEGKLDKISFLNHPSEDFSLDKEKLFTIFDKLSGEIHQKQFKIWYETQSTGNKPVLSKEFLNNYFSQLLELSSEVLDKIEHVHQITYNKSASQDVFYTKFEDPELIESCTLYSYSKGSYHNAIVVRVADTLSFKTVNFLNDIFSFFKDNFKFLTLNERNVVLMKKLIDVASQLSLDSDKKENFSYAKRDAYISFDSSFMHYFLGFNNHLVLSIEDITTYSLKDFLFLISYDFKDDDDYYLNLLDKIRSLFDVEFDNPHWDKTIVKALPQKALLSFVKIHRPKVQHAFSEFYQTYYPENHEELTNSAIVSYYKN